MVHEQGRLIFETFFSQDGSKEAPAAHYADKFYDVIEQSGVDVIFDDRTQLTIGKRLLEARRTGYPYIVIIGKRAIDTTPVFEMHDLNASKQLELSFEGVIDYLRIANENQEISDEISRVRCKSV